MSAGDRKERILLCRHDGKQERSAMMREELRLAGVSAEWINRLHAPIGLSIGAQTPEEIAVAVLATDSFREKQGRKSPPCRVRGVSSGAYVSERGREICSCHNFGETGSAPRKEGTHFIVGRIRTVFERVGEAIGSKTSCRQRWNDDPRRKDPDRIF